MPGICLTVQSTEQAAQMIFQAPSGSWSWQNQVIPGTAFCTVTELVITGFLLFAALRGFPPSQISNKAIPSSVTTAFTWRKISQSRLDWVSLHPPGNGTGWGEERGMKFLKQAPLVRSFQAGSVKLPLAGFPPTSLLPSRRTEPQLHPTSPENTHPWGWACPPTEKVKSCCLMRWWSDHITKLCNKQGDKFTVDKNPCFHRISLKAISLHVF